MSTFDLDNTSSCPRTGTCESCGGDLDVTTETAGSGLGVFCVRVCLPCAEHQVPLAVAGWGHLAERVLAHCEHLGITAETMAAVLAVEEHPGGGR